MHVAVPGLHLKACLMLYFVVGSVLLNGGLHECLEESHEFEHLVVGVLRSGLELIDLSGLLARSFGLLMLSGLSGLAKLSDFEDIVLHLFTITEYLKRLLNMIYNPNRFNLFMHLLAKKRHKNITFTLVTFRI